jgi:uncharacterized repeat protein (TIGR01451 family)
MFFVNWRRWLNETFGASKKRHRQHRRSNRFRPECLPLEDRLAPATVVAVGAGPGGGPVVKVYNGSPGTLVADFFAFAPSFTGGVHVAVADVNGDGVPDIIVAAGAGGSPEVKVIDGTKFGQLQANGEIASSALLADFFAYAPSFTGGVNVAAGDVNGDGILDIIVGTGAIIVGTGAGGGPEVKVIDGTKLGQIQPNGEIASSALLADFFAYAPSFTGGVNVAAGDVNGDGVPDIIVGAGAGGEPEVKVIDGTKLGQIQPNGEIASSALLADFFAYAPSFTGGVNVAAGDVNGDGVPDIIVGAGAGGEPEVKAIDGTKLSQIQPNGEIASSALLADFFAFAVNFSGGVFVAASASPPSILATLGAASISVNGSTTLTISITNPNSALAFSGIAFTDNLPAGLVVATPSGLTNTGLGGLATAVAGSSSVSLSGGSLAAGASGTIVVYVTGTTAGVKNESVQVTSTNAGTGNTSTPSITVVAPPAITIAFHPTAIAPNATTTLTFTITNPAANTAALTGVAFTDTLPAGLTVVTSSSSVGGGTLTTTAPASIVLSGAGIPVNSQLKFNVTVIGATVGNYNDATSAVTSTNGGSGLASNTAPLAVHPLLQVSQTIVPTPIYEGSHYAYSITVSNLGNAAVSGVTVRDVLPLNAVFLGSLPFGYSVSAGVLTVNVGTVAGNSTTTFTVAMSVPFTTPIGASIMNDISVRTAISGSVDLYTSMYSFMVTKPPVSKHWG